MRSKFLLSTMLIWLALGGCSESINEVVLEKPVSNVAESNLDKAILTATKALQGMRQTTRGGEDYSVESVYPVLSKGAITKSSNVDTLLYLINYNDGFAIVGAQNSTDQVFAISDDGQINITDTIANPILARFINAYADCVTNNIVNESGGVFIESFNTLLEYMPPLIQAEWGQNGGFCALYDDGGPAGCVPVAVGQICYYYKKPQSFNGYQFNWDLMRNIKSRSDFSNNVEAGEQVSRFLYEIAQNMGTENGSTFENKIVPCFSAMGYSASYDWMNISVIREGIMNASAPYIVGAAASIGGRHAWVIDGYRETETKTKYLGASGFFYRYQYDYYLHCNWGWDGIANGYYRYADSSGMLKFDTISGAEWGGDGTTSIYVFDDDFTMFSIFY